MVTTPVLERFGARHAAQPVRVFLPALDYGGQVSRGQGEIVLPAICSRWAN
jgi:hypothetical protein